MHPRDMWRYCNSRDGAAAQTMEIAVHIMKNEFTRCNSDTREAALGAAYAMFDESVEQWV